MILDFLIIFFLSLIYLSDKSWEMQIAGAASLGLAFLLTRFLIKSFWEWSFIRTITGRGWF